MLGGVPCTGPAGLLGLSLFLCGYDLGHRCEDSLRISYFRQQQLPFMPTFGFAAAPLPAFLLFSGLMGNVPALIMRRWRHFPCRWCWKGAAACRKRSGWCPCAARQLRDDAGVGLSGDIAVALSLLLLLLPLFPLLASFA